MVLRVFYTHLFYLFPYIADIPLPFDNVRKEISLEKNLILRSKPSANVQPEYRMFVLVAPA